MESGTPTAFGHRMAVLAGRRDPEEDAFYVYGALDFPVESQGNGYHMSTATWTGIYAGMRQHFPECEILGWYLTREETDVEKEEWLLHFHQEYFAGENKIFFYYNPAELEERMYLYEDGRLKKQGGYFIFYEKNEAMQNLLIARNQEFGPAKKVSVLAETVHSPMEMIPQQGAAEEPSLEPEDRVVREIRRTIEIRQEKGQEQKTEKPVRTGRWAGAAAAILLAAACGLGFGYEERLNGMEATILQLSSRLEKYVEETTSEEMELADQVTENTDKGGVLEVETLPGGVEAKPEIEEGAVDPELPVIEVSGEDIQEEIVEEVPVEPEVVEEPDKSPDKAATEEVTVSGPLSYVVKPGDTLLAICLRQYGDGSMIQAVMEANGITDPDGIFAGDVLILP